MKRSFEVKEDCRLIQAVSENIAGLGKPAIKLLLKAGEIRVNGQKQLFDCPLKAFDNVSVFLPQKYEKIKEPEIIFADENVVIADKPPRFDVENNLLGFVKKTYPDALAVHRLDRGTSGLVIFALNNAAYDSLTAAFKERSLNKVYYAAVEGNMTRQGVFKAYLLKDADKGEVKIFDTSKAGSKKIETQIDVVTASKDKSLLKIGLITGRTHQIRAHLAHLGHPVLGDGKYGFIESKDKKEVRVSTDFEGGYALCAAEIGFVGLKPPLEYLNGKVFYSAAQYLLTKNFK